MVRLKRYFEKGYPYFITTNTYKKLPIFTDEKFVRMAYEERVSEWEDLDIKQRLESPDKNIQIRYNKIDENYFIKDTIQELHELQT